MRVRRIETVIQFVRDPQASLVTLNDPDGNIVGFIDDSKGGMPGQRA